MDEVAFVESLFQPELRSTPQPSPTRSLLISASQVPSTSPLPSPTLSSPRLRSFKFMQATGNPAVSPATLRVGVGPEEEEVFRQLLSDHEFDETLAMTTHVEGMVDHLQASNLLEPIELPKNSAGNVFLDATLKDVFLSMPSPMLASPSAFGTPNYKMFSPTNLTPRGSLLDPHRTPRHGSYSDNLMPVQPIGASSTPSNYVNQVSSMSAIEALQQAVWSNNPNGNIQRLNPNSIKDVVRAATSATAPRNASAPSPLGSSTLMTTPRVQLQPPATPLWVHPALLTPTNLGQNAPDLTRNISSKKSKARKSSQNLSTAKSSSTASALTSSLLGDVSVPRKRTASTKAKVVLQARTAATAAVATDSNDSDETDSKATKGKKCVEEGCVRRAQSNSRCKAHGGGARCQYDGPGGCTRSSQGGGFCRAHGGGKRCEYPDCTRGQQRKGRCYVHGGIRKCQTDGCEKKDRGNGFCISHGGGKRCVFPGCSRSVRRGNVCQLHEDTASVSSAT